MRAPEAPSGWPSAMAPPFGLKFSSLAAIPSSRVTARTCDAKASLSSITSKSAILNLWRPMSLATAGTAPMPITRGATPALAAPMMRANGLRAYFSTDFSEAISKAAAPSLTPEELPAVTVPSLRKSVGNFASFSTVVPARGCSSFATNEVSPFFCGTGTAMISSAKRPLSCALTARAWLCAA